MARTITALFETRSDADAGAERLRQAGIDAGAVNVHDQSTHKTAGDHSSSQDKGLWASIKNVFLPDADRHTYEEGIRRGGFLLTADVDDDKTPAAVKALEAANSIDLDERSRQWQSQGWTSPTSDTSFDETSGDIYGERDADYGSPRFRSYSGGTGADRDI